jgi:hypothetical protein
VEVKIGVTYAARELVIDSAQSPEEVEAIVAAALKDGSVLNLEDEKGRRVLIPIEKLAYVEIAEPEARRVGFGAI